MSNFFDDFLNDCRIYAEQKAEEERKDRKNHPIFWFFKDMIPFILGFLIFMVIISILICAGVGFYILFLS